MGLWTDIIGSTRGYIVLAFNGVRLKNSSGNLVLRNATDTADAVLLPQSGGVPTGAMFSFPSTTAPTGYHELDGSLLSRTTYATLYDFAVASGNIVSDASWQDGNFSYGDGSTTFRIPDRRGNFGRGWDHSRGIDSGRAIGTLQLDAMQGHHHSLAFPYTGASGGSLTVALSTIDYPNIFSNYASGAITDGVHGTPRIASETVPRNVAELWCIKL